VQVDIWFWAPCCGFHEYRVNAANRGGLYAWLVHPMDRNGQSILNWCVVGALLLPGAALALSVILTLTTEVGSSTYSPSWDNYGQMFVWTICVSTIIAVLATSLGLVSAWALRSTRWRASTSALGALMFVAMLMPSYLAYAGWGLIRQPDWPVGRWLFEREAWQIILANRALALLGMIVWMWPLATVLLLPTARSVTDDQIDQFSLVCDRRQVVRSIVFYVRRQSSGIGVCLLVLAALAVGSALPLHLAQMPTISIELWRASALHGVRVWLDVWPVVIVAMVAAWMIARSLANQTGFDLQSGMRTEARGLVRLGAWLTWVCGALVPLMLFVLTLRSWHVVEITVREQAGAIGTSVLIGLGTGAGLGGLCVISAWATSLTRGSLQGRSFEKSLLRKTLFICLFSSVLWLLLPGVMLGQFVSAGVNRVSDFASGLTGVSFVPDSLAFVCMSHVLRFSCIGIVTGVVLAKLEPRALVDARLNLAGTGVRAWWRLFAIPRIGTFLAVVVAGVVLSLSEIEMAVQLMPPGYRSVAQVMLDQLHMNSVQEMAAMGAVVMGCGLVLMVIGGGLSLWLCRRVDEL
jgi:ABC-type Fe3+ transport system permease subunit